MRTYPEQDFFDGTAQAALKAILFIYAKLNPGVSYVQVCRAACSGITRVVLKLCSIIGHERAGGNALLRVCPERPVRGVGGPCGGRHFLLFHSADVGVSGGFSYDKYAVTLFL